MVFFNNIIYFDSFFYFRVKKIILHSKFEKRTFFEEILMAFLLANKTIFTPRINKCPFAP